MRSSKGQSLVEVVVAIGAMSLLLVALLTTISLSVKNSRLAKDRNQAVALANEGIELMRAYRDYDWDLFYAEARVDSYDLPYNWVVEDALSADCQTLFDIRDMYRRCVTLTVDEPLSSIDVEVLVEWEEGTRTLENGNAHQVTQNTRLSLWER